VPSVGGWLLSVAAVMRLLGNYGVVSVAGWLSEVKSSSCESRLVYSHVRLDGRHPGMSQRSLMLSTHNNHSDSRTPGCVA